MKERISTIRGDSWYQTKEHRLWRSVFIWIIPLIAASLSALGGILLKAFSVEDPFFWVGGGIPIAVALLTIGAQQYRQRLHDRASWLQRHTLTSFTDNLTAIHDPLIRLYKSEQTQEDVKAFLNDFTRGGSYLFAYDGLRVCVYALDSSYFDGANGESRDDGANTSRNRTLKLIAYGGRSDFPRPDFTTDTSYGDRAIQIALQHVAYPVRSVERDDLEIDRPDSSIWKSFMAFPIRSLEQPLGVLMIDARDEIKWTEQDHAIGCAISALIADGVSAYIKASTDAIPETMGLLEALRNQGEENALYNVDIDSPISLGRERSDSSGNHI